jgi:iron complex outermembrane recepter protein
MLPGPGRRGRLQQSPDLDCPRSAHPRPGERGSVATPSASRPHPMITLLVPPGPFRHLAAGITLAFVLPVPGSGQAGGRGVPADTLRGDSIPTIRVEGIRVIGGRAVTTPGGSSAVQARVDSLAVPPASSLETVLRSMPLIQLRTNSRGEAQPALRGGEDRQVAVIYDGIPLTLGWDHRTDLSLIPMSAARSITLSRGLPSVLLGPNVTTGVVEVDLARGEDRLTGVDPLTASVGVEGTGGYSVAATGESLLDRARGQWVFRMGAGLRDRPGFAAPPRDRESRLGARERHLRLNSDVRQVNGYLQGRYRADSGAWFSIAASGFDLERGVPPETHTPDPRLWRYPEQRKVLAAITGGTGFHRTPWGEGDAEFAVGIDLGRYRIDSFRSLDFEEVIGTEAGDDRTLTLRLLWDHTLGERGELRGTATLADITHDEEVDGEEALYRQRLWSLASETLWRLPWGYATSLSVGASLDGADTPETAGRASLGRLDAWGGRVGLSTANPSGTMRLHVAASRRMRFPSLRELYSGALGRFLPNPDLRPEEQRGLEAGITLSAAGSELQVVGFHDRRSDGIVRTTVQTPEGSKFFRINQDRVHGYGVELLAAQGFGPATLGGDLTLQRVRAILPDGDAELEYEPAVVGRLSLSSDLPGKLRATADLRFRGAQRCVDPAGDGLLPLDAARLLDLGMERSTALPGGNRSPRLPSLVTLSVGVDNVTDALVLDQCGLPRPGRNFRIQLRVF